MTKPVIKRVLIGETWHPVTKKSYRKKVGIFIIAFSSFDSPTEAKALGTLPLFYDKATVKAVAKELGTCVPKSVGRFEIFSASFNLKKKSRVVKKS